MISDTVKKNLFSSTTRLYGVLDGGMVPDLPQRLFDSRLPHYCLRSGELDADMLALAPYLVFLPEGHEFTTQVFDEGSGNNWGIFAHSASSMIEMRKHFHDLLTVYTEAGNAMYFRYFDPRVIRRFLPTCNGGELKTFFGKSEALFAESDSGESLVRYTVADGKLETKELS